MAEELPVGWGDTYIQSIVGQSFNITHVPDGTYYIEVAANPEKVLYETTTSNDLSYRKIILGGTPGPHRGGAALARARSGALTDRRPRPGPAPRSRPGGDSSRLVR